MKVFDASSVPISSLMVDSTFGGYMCVIISSLSRCLVFSIKFAILNSVFCWFEKMSALLVTICCQAQPKPKPSFGLRWLYFHLILPPTQPSGQVWIWHQTVRLWKQKLLVYVIRPQNCFRTKSQPQKYPNFGHKGPNDPKSYKNKRHRDKRIRK